MQMYHAQHALDALHAIKVEYDVLDHLVHEEDALKDRTKKTTAQANVQPSGWISDWPRSR